MTATDFPARGADQIVQLDVESIRAHAKNLRADATDVDELARSIASEGVIEPLIVAPHPDRSDDWLLIAGHRRLNASIRAGLPTVPCIIRYDLSDLESQLVTMLGENTQRANLSQLEEARGVQALLDLGVTVARVAKRTGRKRDQVDAVSRLARASADAQRLVEQDRATLDDLAVIEDLAADDPEERQALEIALIGGRGAFDYAVAARRAELVRAAQLAPTIDNLKARGVRHIFTSDVDFEAAADEIVTRLLEQHHDDEDDVDGPAWLAAANFSGDLVFEQLGAEPDTITDEHTVLVEHAPATVLSSKPTIDISWWRRRTDAEITTVPDSGHAPAAAPVSAEDRQREAERRHAQEQAAAQAEGLRAAVLARAAHARRRAIDGDQDAQATEWMRQAVLDKARRFGDLSAQAVILGLDPATHTIREELITAGERALRGLPLPTLVALHRVMDRNYYDLRLAQPMGWKSQDQGAALGRAWFRELRDTWAYTPSEVEVEMAEQMPADDPDPDGAQ